MESEKLINDDECFYIALFSAREHTQFTNPFADMLDGCASIDGVTDCSSVLIIWCGHLEREMGRMA